MLKQRGFSVPILAVLALVIFVGIGAFNLGRSTFRFTTDFKINQKKSSVPAVPQFSSGRIAFLKQDGNVYVATPDGRTEQITKDATKQISQTFNYPLEYRYPIWSPDGDKFAFEQLLNKTEKAHVLISDGRKAATKYPEVLKVYWNLPPFWYKNDKITLADLAITTSTLDLFEYLEETDVMDSPFFREFNKPNGCGGGGRSDWSYKLSWNHMGGMDGIRATFLYLNDEKELIYSTGCENNVVERITKDGKISPFDKNNDPKELQLSYDRGQIVGISKGNVVLYDAKGKLVKTLTKSGKAYGPVFSHDGKTIFYADNFGGIPTLERVSTDGTNQKTIFTGKVIGATSNISSSPDSSQLIFTLIQQDKPTNVETGDYPEARQDLYLIDSDGNNLKLFLNDAYQASWSPK